MTDFDNKVFEVMRAFNRPAHTDTIRDKVFQDIPIIGSWTKARRGRTIAISRSLNKMRREGKVVFTTGRIGGVPSVFWEIK